MDGIRPYYQDALDDYLMVDEKEAIQPVLEEVLRDNFSSFVFRTNYGKDTISNSILEKVLEVYESRKQMVHLLGKDVGGLTSQYLY